MQYQFIVGSYKLAYDFYAALVTSVTASYFYSTTVIFREAYFSFFPSEFLSAFSYTFLPLYLASYSTSASFTLKIKQFLHNDVSILSNVERVLSNRFWQVTDLYPFTVK